LLDAFQPFGCLFFFELLLLLGVVDFLLELLQPLLVIIEDGKHAFAGFAFVEGFHGDQSQLLVGVDSAAELLFEGGGGALVGAGAEEDSLVVVNSI
jgi:hypothetical protein